MSPKNRDKEDEDLIRLNLVIHKDTLNTLDQMKENGYFGSRGKTIESLIDVMPEVASDLQAMIQITSEKNWWNNVNKTMLFLFAYADLMRRLGRFLPKTG